ncbi:hypothetical protein H072_11074 [Dactylellina haptotyla CBS 200.50]|uniref:Rhodopsin domain-containing protein n=1 Tax=Dactylellina haptotyla (strain CBS 200.50) TaxID=1284197 RepID=S8BJW4_DACHA|nr:hypothetical protein H072_11074 [Dactylellina haptotyla CBS 200.50]
MHPSQEQSTDLILVPPSVMLAWPKPNLIDPENQGWKILAWEIPLITLTILIVCLRVYAKRYYTKHGLGREDWLILSSTLLTLAIVIMQCVSVQYGWGLHLYDFAPLAHKYLQPARKLAFGMEILFTLAINLTKLSILTFYLRIFPIGVVSIHLHRLIYVGMAITTLAMIGSLVAAIFQCSPIEHFWIYNMKGYCYPTFPLHLSTAIINTVTDFYCVIVPLGEICGLTRVDRRGKWVVIICFALGAMVCFAGAIRIYFTNMVFHSEPFDWTWDSINLYVASAFECTVGIVTASIPCLRPLFTKSTTRKNGDLESESHQKRRSAARKKRRTGMDPPPPLEFVTTALKEKSDVDSITPLTAESGSWREVKIVESPRQPPSRRTTRWTHWI